jgi:cytochrome c1
MGPRALTCSLALCILLVGCERPRPVIVAPGDPHRGRSLVIHYGCGGCHSIPGVQGADATVGPSLSSIGQRVYIGGKFPNTPANMAVWIREAQQLKPGVAMPDFPMPQQDARDIVAFLYRVP